METSTSATMTSSMPNLEANTSPEPTALQSKSELDKIGDRLGKFMSRQLPRLSPSRLPKPEISPKPAHLVAQLATGRPIVSPKNEAALKIPGGGTASMLKSTLSRMTKLTTSPAVNRSNSFKEPEIPMRKASTLRNPGPGSIQRSNSLRKVKNKDLAINGSTNTLGNYPLTRSGTSGTLDSRIKRTPSMNSARRFRDRDLNVKLSRGVQTQLTKDTVDEPEFTDDGSIPTK
jgi:hypothetical protein